ncbi:hypothetical protein Cgig2_018936 [Carnegiea gigantea]|uniref:Cytochrome C biogenesis protein transmembrane domain-containing protein n=1 Tax=Carnegiea gigantea TaxID=171969 RepID=A0A9Q1GU63_9CARY|nr:hypothetical protein Cgig2_018936 [Carnegiea gigantea]
MSCFPSCVFFLFQIIEFQLPSFFNDFDPRAAAARFPSSVQAYLAGLTFALAASPCSTPVLATLLGYVASTKDPLIGGSLLLTYTTGYVAPLLLAASFAGALQVAHGLESVPMEIASLQFKGKAKAATSDTLSPSYFCRTMRSYKSQNGSSSPDPSLQWPP